MKIFKRLLNYWWVFVLIVIFFYAFYIRTFNIVPDRLLSFDPIFQHRMTKYFIDWGHMPLWDELTYYVGRVMRAETAPVFMYYLTSISYFLFSNSGLSLMTIEAYTAAFYGGLIVFAAFLLGRGLSNKYGGLIAALLIGAAPQIIIRTFGSSYDNDQLVVFFIVLTIYLGIRAIRKKTIESICFAVAGFTAFMLTWWSFAYTFYILILILLGSIALDFIRKLIKKQGFFTSLIKSISEKKPELMVLGSIFLGLFITNLIVISIPNLDHFFEVWLFEPFKGLVLFVGAAERWIVNISIAELQPFSIFNIEGWFLATGRFITGNPLIDYFFFLSILISIFAGLYLNYKKRNFRNLAIVVTIFLIAIVTTFRGIRFTEFTTLLFLSLVGAGIGELIEFIKDKNFLKPLVVGFVIVLLLFVVDIGIAIGKQMGPDTNPNWDGAWDFLRTETPELSLIGTWWDPGHMITGLAERRVIGDGAHCLSPFCLYTINDRITDLGKIMATNDENESINLIRKYQGTSPKVYWIASDDLIGKFQWCQYFGTGCDARYDPSCPLYMQLGIESTSTDQAGNIVIRKYGSVHVYEGGNIPIPIFVQGINGAIFKEIIFYEDGIPKTLVIDDQQKEAIINTLKPLERQLNFRFVNQTIQLAVWVPQHRSYIVLIPDHQRNNVFTKMFFLEGQGLEHFKQVYRNEQVKIYEVI